MNAALRVEMIVALMGPPFCGSQLWDGTDYDDRTNDEPYDARAKAVIAAATSDLLGDVIDRAAASLDIWPSAD